MYIPSISTAPPAIAPVVAAWCSGWLVGAVLNGVAVRLGKRVARDMDAAQVRSSPVRASTTAMMTAMTFAFVTLCLGAGPQALAGCLLAAALIVASIIDIEHHLLPDVLTFPLVWSGLLFNVKGMFIALPDAVGGAIAGYLALTCLSFILGVIRPGAQIGGGDIKLYAALGAWLGWVDLPLIALLAAGSFSVGMALLARASHRNVLSRAPFGSFLAFSGVVVLCLSGLLA